MRKTNEFKTNFHMSDVYAQGILEPKHQDILHVDWVITKTCNYHCSYCFYANKPNCNLWTTYAICYSP